jgi:hypothetical protein
MRNEEQKDEALGSILNSQSTSTLESPLSVKCQESLQNPLIYSTDIRNRNVC